MSRANAIRDARRPLKREDRDTILRELQDVLASPHFCNSKRYPALLQYVVERTLAGESELLKERTLGVEVFDRPSSYDTNADTVVRYTAGEVRKRLSLYYHELGHKPLVQISLPAGSYVPDFLHRHDEPEGGLEHAETDWEHLAAIKPEKLITSVQLVAAQPMVEPRMDRLETRAGRFRISRMLFVAACVSIAVVALGAWKYRAARPRTALEDFWALTLHEQKMVPICVGGSAFARNNNFSGVVTAGKDIDYPFISMQSASAIAQLSTLLDRNGATTELKAAGSTPITELREHSSIFVGGYNNQWSLRLLQPLRFHFAPEENAAIVDSAHPEVRWERDHRLTYASADDYALLTRFRDPTTDGWVVVLAGLGRNGTEAAAQFATSPRYMQLLRDRVGDDLANRNIEMLLKVSVVDGKTGAPLILATHVW
jgi:hypothetical protein